MENNITWEKVQRKEMNIPMRKRLLGNGWRYLDPSDYISCPRCRAGDSWERVSDEIFIKGRSAVLYQCTKCRLYDLDVLTRKGNRFAKVLSSREAALWML